MNDTEQIVALLKEIRDEIKVAQEMDAAYHADNMRLYAEHAQIAVEHSRRAEALNQSAANRWTSFLIALAAVQVALIIAVLSK